MRRFALALCLVLSLLSCRKKTSAEFYRVDGEIQVLVAKEGDDAWVSAEMQALEQQLQAIPADVVEAPKVQALLAKLQAERGRVKAERDAEQAERDTANAAAAAANAPAAAEPTEPDPAQPTGDGDDANAADAGPPADPVPTLGMPEADFLARFGACVTAGPAVAVPGGLKGASQVVSADAQCQKRLGEAGVKTSFVFVDGKLHGKQTETPGTVQLVDAGSPPPKPPPPAPPPTFHMMGAPLPEGVPPPGAEPPAK